MSVCVCVGECVWVCACDALVPLDDGHDDDGCDDDDNGEDNNSSNQRGVGLAVEQTQGRRG